MIELRFAIYCKQSGEKTDPILQYRFLNPQIGGQHTGWMHVPTVEIKVTEINRASLYVPENKNG